MNIGITGLTSAGKTTLFSSFTGNASGGQTTGIVRVPDERLDKLSALFNPEKHTNTTINFYDCPPMDTQVKQDKIKLFDTLKVMDVLACVVGAYKHTSPKEIIDEFKQLRFELIMSDLDFVTKRIERLEKEIKKIAKNRAVKEKEMNFMQKLQQILEGEKMLQGLEFDDAEKEIITNANLLTLKPVCYVINVAEGIEDDFAKAVMDAVSAFLKENGDTSPVFTANLPLEAELSAMEPDEVADYMKEFGIKEAVRDNIIKAVYDLLNLITFFTVGEDECRAWTIKQGGGALDAAGAIHSDLARGFIKAEVIECGALLEYKSMPAAKKAGKVRLEGKNYLVKNGDIVHIMFNV